MRLERNNHDIKKHYNSKTFLKIEFKKKLRGFKNGLFLARFVLLIINSTENITGDNGFRYLSTNCVYMNALKKRRKINKHNI